MPFTDSGTARVWWDSAGAGTPVLLINGLSSPSAVWFRLVPLLAARHRVLTFDNLGTGQTRTPDEPYSMAMHADAAAAVLGAAAEPAVHVLGISMGGLVAQELALEHPALVASLTLVSTHAGAPHMSSNQDGLDALAKAAALPGSERARYLNDLVYAKTTPAERIEEDMAVRAQHPTSEEGYRNQLQGALEWERLSELPGITCPTLVLHGEQDLLVAVENAHALAQHIPAAQLTVLPGCGHQLFTDQPEAGARAVLDFLGSVDAGIRDQAPESEGAPGDRH